MCLGFLASPPLCAGRAGCGWSAPTTGAISHWYNLDPMISRFTMTRGLSSPHLLLASSNPMKMIQNLNHLLAQQEIDKLTAELDRNVTALYALGQSHFTFASNLPNSEWRQIISRLYYGVYNVRRAVTLKHSGAFSTDSSDHKNIDQLPAGILHREAHISNLRNLREDRNLADYSHLAAVTDLVMSPADALMFSQQFIADSQNFLLQEGVAV